MKAYPALELRSSVRFPLRLQASIHEAGRPQQQAETRDISAAGILFYVAAAMPVGARFKFTIELPAEVLGSRTAVAIEGLGRVMRCVPEDGRCAVAAVIDEYRFERT